MAEAKTKPTAASVQAFLKRVPDEGRRQDSLALLQVMKQITKAEPKMWGPSIVGFGSHHFVYGSGREGDWPLAAFSPRKQDLTVYILGGFPRYAELMVKLGKHTTGKSCLYIKRLSDVDPAVLKKLITESMKWAKANYKQSDPS